MKKGIVYISFGSAAVASAAKSLDSIRKLGIDLPVVSIGSDAVPGTRFIRWAGEDPWQKNPPRKAESFLVGGIKSRINELSPFEWTLYLDSDTVVLQSIIPGFEYLNRYDICLVNHRDNICIKDIWAQEPYQDPAHANKLKEKSETMELVDGNTPLVNSGVIFYRKCEQTDALFANWYLEFQKYHCWDEQLSLHRAIHNCKGAKIYYLPEAWNKKHRTDETIIWHRMGSGVARRSR